MSTAAFIVGQNLHKSFGIKYTDFINELTANPWNPPDGIQHINVGFTYFIITDQAQHHWCAGTNESGQLGLGLGSPRTLGKFTKNAFFKKHVQIKRIFSSVTGSNTFWLTDDDRVYANGANQNNQLGIYGQDRTAEPLLIDTLSCVHIADIQVGGSHCIALDEKGTVYATKYRGYSGDYGQNTGNTRCAETGFSAIAFFWHRAISIKLIAAGFWHSVFVDESNGVWSCGINRFAQCGLGAAIDTTKQTGPQKIAYFGEKGVNVQDVQCGASHTLVLAADGKVYSFGKNQHGQCGVDMVDDCVYSPVVIEAWKEEKMVQIKCGYDHSYARSGDGRHYLFGCNACNACSLTECGEEAIWSPLCVNRRVCELTNGRCVEHVYLGVNATWIITSFDVKYCA